MQKRSCCLYTRFQHHAVVVDAGTEFPHCIIHQCCSNIETARFAAGENSTKKKVQESSPKGRTNRVEVYYRSKFILSSMPDFTVCHFFVQF